MFRAFGRKMGKLALTLIRLKVTRINKLTFILTFFASCDLFQLLFIVASLSLASLYIFDSNIQIKMSNPNTSLSSSAKHKLIPSGASEYFSLSASHDIYFSLRMGDMELLEEAYALFNILRKYGHSPMIVGDIKQSLIQNLDNVKMLLVFGTEDYGTEPSWEYGTKAELQYCSENNKPYFVLEMCNQYTSPWTQKKLTEPGVAGCVWPHGTKMPERLGYVISRFYFDKVASIDELVDVLNSGWGLDKQDKYECKLICL